MTFDVEAARQLVEDAPSPLRAPWIEVEAWVYIVANSLANACDEIERLRRDLSYLLGGSL